MTSSSTPSRPTFKSHGLALVAGLAAFYCGTAVAALSHGDWGWLALTFTLVLGTALVALSVIDVRTLRLPDALTLPLLLCGLLAVYVCGLGDPVWHAVAAVVALLLLYAVATLFRRFRGVDALGFGDAKLYAAAGAWVGPAGLAEVLLLGSGLALAGAAIAALWGADVRRDTRIPFGPFLAAGHWLVWLFGPGIVL